jgi:hypothetical protein
MGGRAILLVLYLLILASPPLAIKMQDLRFEAQRQEYIQKNGSSEGFYGDCTGVTSVIIPAAVCIYAMAFFIWTLTFVFKLKRPLTHNGKVQLAVIGTAGVLPVLMFSIIGMI